MQPLSELKPLTEMDDRDLLEEIVETLREARAALESLKSNPMFAAMFKQSQKTPS